ncbi:MAG: disulfide bond formation protein B [Caulobacterales bacterium]
MVFISWLRSNWPFVALVASASLLAAAHAFETFGSLAPCALCLKQREVHWGIVALAAASLVALRRKPQLASLVNIALGFAFLLSFGVAAYHVGVELKLIVAQCEGGDLSQLGPLLESGPLELPSCDKPAWTLFGVSMAGYNALISLALAALSFFFARKASDA